jgi:UDP-glucuronate 4-epimerase
MKVLVTGAAGFIGAATSASLLEAGHEVVGLDSLNTYYPVALKRARLGKLSGREGFSFLERDLADGEPLVAELAALQPDLIIHLAAQAGVRASSERPFDYVRANLMGHMTILEAARRLPHLRHLVYASSSSVYGNRTGGAFRETDRVDEPQSLYAATKRADELMSAVYCEAYGLTATGLRFFTVYGPMGRPDMAYWTFAEAILAGQPVTVFDGGQLRRDFTYIDDIVSGILAVAQAPVARGGHRVYNIGNHRPETVAHLVDCLEAALGVTAIRRDAPKPSYDVDLTYADIARMQADFGWSPTTPLATGIGHFASWFKEWRQRQPG